MLVQDGCEVPLNDIGLPLTAAQLGVWFAQKITPLSPAFNIAEYIEISGAIDPGAFTKSVEQLVRETDALRVRLRGLARASHRPSRLVSLESAGGDGARPELRPQRQQRAVSHRERFERGRRDQLQCTRNV